MSCQQNRNMHTLAYRQTQVSNKTIRSTKHTFAANIRHGLLLTHCHRSFLCSDINILILTRFTLFK